jgi:hypothetical protein
LRRILLDTDVSGAAPPAEALVKESGGAVVSGQRWLLNPFSQLHGIGFLFDKTSDSAATTVKAVSDKIRNDGSGQRQMDGNRCSRTRTTGNGRFDKKRKEMKTEVISVACFLTIAASVSRSENKPPYLIRRGHESLAVSNMPTFTVSEPITNSFVYIDGEYIEPPYVVSVSNLAVCINGRAVRDFEPWVSKREAYPRRVGITPETVGSSVDYTYESYVRRLSRGIVPKIVQGMEIKSSGLYDGDGGASAFIGKARKAAQGNEQARQELITEMGLEGAMQKIRPDWIQRLAGNTNLEARATRILEAKRQREQHERERRERMERQDRQGNPRQDGNAHQ